MADLVDFDSRNTHGPTRLGFSSEKDLGVFVDTLEKFEKGELDPDAWRAFRLVNGVYGQRQDDVMMIRSKIPMGILTVPQLRALAEVSERWSVGRGHLTTRQNVQFHFVKLEDSEAALRTLADSGMTTKEACGNAVRNVTTCHFAGVAATEPFDVTPYAEALVRYLLGGPLSSTLPRKFKIAFGGCCGNDCVGAAFHDLGFLARVQDGRRGFHLSVGGGLATLRRPGVVAHEFLPVEELFEAAEAVLRIFDRLGNRKNRNKARLKFVMEKLGPEGFLAEYRAERARVAAEGGRPLTLPPAAPPRRPKSPPPLPALFDFPVFRAKNVRPQQQAGYSTVLVRAPLGDFTTAQFRTLADLAGRYSEEEEVRTTIDQNLVFRFVRDEQVASLHAELAAAGLARPGAGTVADVTSCPGAMSCKLAVTQSRGLATLVGDYLDARPDLVARAEKLSIKASGCPNGCGQHHVAGLGFQGGVRKIGGRAAPVYLLHIGGSIGPVGGSFGRLVGKVPARRAGLATERLIDLYDRTHTPGESPDAFFARLPVDEAKALLADLLDMNESTATEQDFIDLGEKQAFEVVLGEGECAA